LFSFWFYIFVKPDVTFDDYSRSVFDDDAVVVQKVMWVMVVERRLVVDVLDQMT
jgi:hypothetical protein